MIVSKMQDQIQGDLSERPAAMNDASVVNNDRKSHPLKEFNESCQKLRLQQIMQAVAAASQ